MPQKILSEYLGTLLLVFSVVGSGIMAENLSPTNEGIVLLANAIATGAMLYVIISIFGPISGAHFNPVVTLYFRFKSDINNVTMILFIIFQLVGGTSGVILANYIFDDLFIEFSTKERTGINIHVSEAVSYTHLTLPTNREV